MTRGWAIAKGQDVDMATVYAHRRGAVVNWLWCRGYRITDGMPDQVIERLWQDRQDKSVEAVAVDITISDTTA